MQTTKMAFCSERMFRTKTPHFFKIILDNSLRDGKLGIPGKFVRIHGSNLSNPVLLKVPSGADWQVELVKSDGEMWFQNGWKQFADFYSVSRGYFLVFEFKGGNEFHVLIFDASATEIDYPLIPRNGKNKSNYRKTFQEPKDEETDDNVSVENLEDCSLSLKKRKKSKSTCPRPKKMMSRAQIYYKSHSSVPSFENQSGRVSMKNPMKEIKRASPTRQFEAKVVDSGMHNKRNKVDMDTGRMKRLTLCERANALYRAVTAFNSDNPFFMVAMQPSYVNPGRRMAIPASFVRKFFKNDSGKVVLCSLDGRSWSLTYSIFACNGSEAAELRGWKQFVIDNNLDVGDVCVFELTNSVGVSLKVSIFRFVPDAPDHYTQGKCVQFKCRISHGREAKSKLAESKGNSHPLSHGREAESKLVESKFNSHPLSHGCEAESKLAESKFNSHPSFTVVLKSYQFRSSYMRLPSGFFGTHILPQRQTVMLQVADRSWPVRLLSYGSGPKVLSGGWGAFLKENSLRVGDVCTFEMFKSRVLKVSISRDGC